MMIRIRAAVGVSSSLRNRVMMIRIRAAVGVSSSLRNRVMMIRIRVAVGVSSSLRNRVMMIRIRVAVRVSSSLRNRIMMIRIRVAVGVSSSIQGGGVRFAGQQGQDAQLIWYTLVHLSKRSHPDHTCNQRGCHVSVYSDECKRGLNPNPERNPARAVTGSRP